MLGSRDWLCVSQVNMGQIWLNDWRCVFNLVTCCNRICDIPNQFYLRMPRERDYFRGVFRSRKIAVSLESDLDTFGDAFRDLTQTRGDPVSCFLACRAILDRVGKNANQWRPKSSGHLRMSERDLHLIRALTRVRRMKHT